MSALQVRGEGKAVLQLVVPPSWVGRINRLAVERGVNRSALIRRAIEAVYFSASDAAHAAASGTGPNEEVEQQRMV